MFNDLPLDQLVDYRPALAEPDDFDAFWSRTLSAAREHPLDARFEPVDAGLRTVDSYDVSFHGSGGQVVKGWLNAPHGADGPLPAVVEFIGYGGGRGLPSDWLLWSAAGYAHLVMDTRGQGSAWLSGDTPDVAYASSPHYPGFLTVGLEDPDQHYYRRLYTDAVRAVEAARRCPVIDPARVAVAGSSQGGGITLAVAGLVPDVAGALPSVPFLCHMRRATQITDAMPYAEVQRYLRTHPTRVERAFATLAYFDGMSFAARAAAPALFSVGLMDEICPPSTVFAAYNRYAGPREIRVWEYAAHEGAGPVHTVEQLRWLAERLGA